MLRSGLAVTLAASLAGCGGPAPPPPAVEAEAAPAGAGAVAPAPVPPASPSSDAPGLPTPEAADPLAGLRLEQELEDVTYRQTRGTRTHWELHAAVVQQFRGAPAQLTGVTLRYYGAQAAPTVVTADAAEYDPDSQHARLRGNVHVVTPEGDSLRSPELEWQGEGPVLRTESEVTLRRGDSHIIGVGLQTSPGLEDVQLFDVRGVIRDAELGL